MRANSLAVRLFLWATTWTVVILIATGIALAVATGKLEASFLYGVKPLDTWTYVVVIVLLLLVGGMAALVPAQRAAVIKPIDTLREE